MTSYETAVTKTNRCNTIETRVKHNIFSERDKAVILAPNVT